MVLFAALTFVGILEHGVPFFVSLAVTLVIMGVLGVVVERAVLRPLVNKPPIILFMATLGLAYILEGAAQLIWGTQVHGLNLGFDDTPLQIGDVLISSFDLFAAAVAATMVALLTAFFRYTHTGLAFRAVADDQFAALAVGLRLPVIWAIVWAAAGFVALVAGLLWGARLGVQFSLSLVVLKALAGSGVGRFRFDPRSDRRRTARSAPPRSWPKSISARSSAAASKSGSPTSSRSASSSFGRPGCSASSSSKGFEAMTAITFDAVARPSRLPRWLAIPAVLLVAYGLIPIFGTSYLFEAILLPFLALSLAALGLNILTGYAGQLSLGSAAFMAVGAFAAYNFNLRIPGLPLIVSLILAGATAAAFGILFGLPSLRLRGFYLAVSTLAAQFFVKWALTRFGWLSNYNSSGVIDAPPLTLVGVKFEGPLGRYLFALTVVVVVTAFAARLVATRSGRNFIAIRDNEIAAKVFGVSIFRTKLLAFGVSSFIIGVAGFLWAFAYLRTVEPDGFNLDRSFSILFIIIIGGLASIRGAFFGAALIVVFPLVLSRLGALIFGGVFNSGVLDMSQRIVIGALIIVFLIAEPNGLVALWDRLTTKLLARA